MTAIVCHKDGWIVADVACTAGLWLIPVTASKIIRFGDHALVSASGLSGLHQETRELQKEHASTLDPLSACDRLVDSLCKLQMHHASARDKEDHRHIMMVTRYRQIISIDQVGMASEYPEAIEWWCGGSGDELCLGFLAGLNHRHPERSGVTSHDAVEAIRFASKYNLGVSYASTMEHL